MAWEVEVASPLMFADIRCLCRVSKNGLIAECSCCGVGMIGRVHMPEVAYGFFCSRCCPACNGQVTLTPEEVEALEVNRRRVGLKARKDEKRTASQRQGAKRARPEVGPEPLPGVDLNSLKGWRAAARAAGYL